MKFTPSGLPSSLPSRHAGARFLNKGEEDKSSSSPLVGEEDKSSSPRNKKPIKIVKIKFVLGENGKPVNATQIIKGRMNKQGKLIKKTEDILQP